MKCFRIVVSVPVIAALLVMTGVQLALAANGPRWSHEQLADFAGGLSLHRPIYGT